MQWLLEILIRVKLNAQVLLDASGRLDALKSAFVKLLRDLAYLADLSLETRILGLLALVRLDDHIIQDSNLFLEIALNVTALSFCNVFYGVLLTFELSNFLACIGHLLFEHHDLFLKAVNGCFETEGLL